MSEDNRGCGSTVAGGVVICAIIFNWFGAGELASGIFQGAVNIVTSVARGPSSGSSSPSTSPTKPPSATIDQRLVGSWRFETSRTNWMSLQLFPTGSWHCTILADKGLFLESCVQEGSSWFVEGNSLILVNESGYMKLERHDAVTGQNTTSRQQITVRQPNRYGFDSYGRLVLGGSNGTTLTLTRSR
jgi:hypothetical protein